MASLRGLRILAYKAATGQAPKITAQKANLGRSVCHLQAPVRNAQVTAALPRLLNNKEIENQRCEQKRYVWPFTQKGYSEMNFKSVNNVVIAKEAIILDVRKFDEVEEIGKIPHAVIVPVEELEEAFELDREQFKERYGFDKPTMDQKIVVYCRTGKRAHTACFALAKYGYKELCRYKGSWEDWETKILHH